MLVSSGIYIQTISAILPLVLLGASVGMANSVEKTMSNSALREFPVKHSCLYNGSMER